MLARPADQIRLGDVVRLLEVGVAAGRMIAASRDNCALTCCCWLKARPCGNKAKFLTDIDHDKLADLALPALGSVWAKSLFRHDIILA